MKNSELKLSHQKGYTDLCFENSGSHIITCGSDGDVRIWNGIDDDEPTSHRVGEQVHAIASANGRFFVATDTNSIQAYTFPDGDTDGIITRFTAPATHICVSNDGQTIAAGSSDFSIKVVRLTTNVCLVLQGHEAPVLSIALDPNYEFLASSSCDGSLRIWKVNEETCVAKFNIFPASNDISLSSTLARLCWYPTDGKYLIVPVENELKVYARNSWNEDFRFTNDEVKSVISICTINNNGEMVAAACNDGAVFIWDWTSRKLLHRMNHESGSKISGLAWNPSRNMQLAYTDFNGYVGTFDHEDPSEDVDRFAPLSPDEVDDVDANPKSLSGMLSDDDDDNNLNISRPFRPSIFNDEDSSEIDIGAIKASLEPKILGTDMEDELKLQLGSNKAVQPQTIIKYAGPEISDPQPAFQTGSTPVNLSHRFMKWNSVGVIQSYNTDEENSIDVEFHDTATHHALHFLNSMNHTVADVSNEAIVFAGPADDDSPSKLVCHHFATWDSSKEWMVELNDDEEFQLVCMGQGWIAAATNLRSIRLFSVGGIQREVLAIPGDIVMIAGCNDLLAVAYHKSIGLKGDQNLGFVMYTVGADHQKYTTPLDLPLSPKSNLVWLGFTDEGAPCHMDSRGVLRMLSTATGKLWTQIINTRDHTKGKLDHHFVIGISEKQQHLRCIFCKGSRYPTTAPRPSVVILPLKLPLCEPFSEKSKLEESIWKHRILSSAFSNVERDEEEVEMTNKTENAMLMKLFALSCKMDREFRASEVASLMPSEHALQLAIKYASRLSRMALAEKIGEIAENRVYGQARATLLRQADEDERIVRHSRSRENRMADEDVEDDAVEIEPDNDDDNDHQVGLEDDISGAIAKAQNRDLSLIGSSPSLASDNAASRNPFKVNAANEVSTKDSNNSIKSIMPGVSAFDTLRKPAPSIRKPLGDKSVSFSSKKSSRKESGQKQSTLFKKKQMAKSEALNDPIQNENAPTENIPKKSGFQLWMDENRTTLLKENPDVDEMALTKVAIKAFKNLSAAEKQKWNQQENGEGDTGSRKRKLEEDGKTKLSSRQKLSGFGFARKD